MLAAGSDASVHYRDIVNSMVSAVLVLDEDLNVLFANLAYYQLFGGREDDTLGHSVFEIGSGLWDDDGLRALLSSVITHQVDVRGYKQEQTFPIIGKRVLNLAARQVSRVGTPAKQTLIEIEDVTNEVRSAAIAEEAAERANTMMTEVNHRVKNNIASILSMLRIESREVTDPDAKDVLQRIALRVESMGSLYELLAVNENTGLVRLRSYFEAMCRAIEAMAAGDQTGWTLEVHGEDVAVGVDDAISIGAVVNELVANASKYAFNGRQDIGRIRVHLEARGETINIAVTDNGVGFDKDAVDPKSTGLGMRLVDMYLASLGGTIDRSSGPQGTACYIEVPNRLVNEAMASSAVASAPLREASRPASTLRARRPKLAVAPGE